jgi:segregation and condensation protein A
LPPDAVVDDPELAAEELGDPREALLKRLLEYQRFKQVGQELALRPVMGRNVWGRGARAADVAAGDVISDAPLAEIPVWELIEALAKTIGRTRSRISHEVTVDRLSLADRINELSEQLDRRPRLEFTDLLRALAISDASGASGSPFGGQIVVTFMAVLEMARLRMLSIYQAEEMGSIYISRPSGFSAQRSVADQRQPELPFPEGEGAPGAEPGAAEPVTEPAAEPTLTEPVVTQTMAADVAAPSDDSEAAAAASEAVTPAPAENPS